MRRWWALCLLVAVAMAVHCDERVELAQRADENRLLAAALADVSRCQTLRCTVRVERRVDGIERRVAAQRKERALLHCDVEKKTSAGEPTTAPSPPLVKEGCVSAKEVELRQKESAVLADLLKQSTACKSLDCIIEVEAKIKRVKKQSRGARHDRNLECASTQPGIAVVGTEKKVGGGGTRRVCAIHAEGICLDMAKELTHEEAQRSCDALTDRYDVRRESFREGVSVFFVCFLPSCFALGLGNVQARRGNWSLRPCSGHARAGNDCVLCSNDRFPRASALRRCARHVPSVDTEELGGGLSAGGQ